MTNEPDALDQRLAELGKRIQRKLGELSSEGVAHPGDRQTAIDMQMKHARLEALAKAKSTGSTHAERDAAVASEVEVTILSIERWLAGIDKGY